MKKATLPIGVFDSGVGGISVLRELMALMPNENYIFFGDSANAPYGTKTLDEVVKLTCKDAAYLYEQGVKAIVVACNTATSAGVKIAKKIRIERKIIAERFVIYCLALPVLLNLSIFLALKILPEP